MISKNIKIIGLFKLNPLIKSLPKTIHSLYQSTSSSTTLTTLSLVSMIEIKCIDRSPSITHPTGYTQLLPENRLHFGISP